MHLIFILVYTYIYWKPLVHSSTVSTNNCIGFILVSSFSVLIMLFSESEESGSCYWQFNNFPSAFSFGCLSSCIWISPFPYIASGTQNQSACAGMTSHPAWPTPVPSASWPKAGTLSTWLGSVTLQPPPPHPPCGRPPKPTQVLLIPGYLILLTWSPLPAYSPCEQAYYFQLHLELLIYYAVTSVKNKCYGKYS